MFEGVTNGAAFSWILPRCLGVKRLLKDQDRPGILPLSCVRVLLTPSSGQHCSARPPKNPKQPALLLRSLSEITIPGKPCMCYVLIFC